MFQALALRALVQGNIKSKGFADTCIVKELCEADIERVKI
jgi:hypothetical protein